MELVSLIALFSFIQYHLNCIFHVLSSAELCVTERRPGIVSENFRMRDVWTSPSIPCLNMYNQMRHLNVGLINKWAIFILNA